MRYLLLVVLLVVPAFAQQTGGRGSGGAPGHPGSVDPNKCDMKTVQDSIYCEKCDKILERDDLLDIEFCKTCNDGKDKKERTKATKVKVCCKKFYECEHHGNTFSKCCGSTKEGSNKAVIQFSCEGCEATSFDQASVKHDNEKHKTNKSKKINAHCKKSGDFPHVNEAAQSKKR